MIEEPYTLGKIGEIAEKFEDIRNYLHVKFVLFPIDQISIILEAIVNSYKNPLKIYFTLGYFGVKDQLEEDVKKDLIAQMNNFMQWSRKEIRNHNRIMKLLDLGQFYAQNNDVRESMRCTEEVLRIDPNNRIALIAKASLLKQLGDLDLSNQFLTKYQNIKANPEKLSTPKLPSIEFEEFVDKIEDSQIKIKKIKCRDVYKKICVDSYGVLDLVMESISFMGKVFQDKNSKTTIEELRIFVDDLLFILSEWLTFDAWSNKLFNASNPDVRGLLQRSDFGTSWLGHRLSFLWRIGSNPALALPSDHTSESPCAYLYAPELFRHVRNENPSNDLLTTIHPEPDASQKKAIITSLNNVVSAILGPPGTGKSQTVAALIDEYLCRNKNKSVKILVTSFSYTALRVVVEKIREKSRDKDGNPTLSSRTQLLFIRSERESKIESKDGCRDVDDLVRSPNQSWKFNGKPRIITPTNLLEEQLEENCIVFANAHQLYHLLERVESDFAFDLVCVDEASQLPVDHILSSLQFVRNHTLDVTTSDSDPKALKLSVKNPPSFDQLTKIVIVGDNNQLPPVRSIALPKKLESVLKSLFSYYVEGHGVPSNQLQVNYRSHKDIVDFTASLGFYQNLRASSNNAEQTLDGDLTLVDQSWTKIVLTPNRVVSAIQHNTNFELGISVIEANIITQIVLGYFKMVRPTSKKEEIEFWTRKVGVVAPHNAQGRTITRQLFEVISPLSRLDQPLLMKLIRNTVYSVEKFQGSDRDLIIASIGLSDLDKLDQESDFIFDINRFNVLTSRAKHKLIFVSSKNFVTFVPEDRKNIENASKIHHYVNRFCNKKMNLYISSDDGSKTRIKFKYKK